MHLVNTEWDKKANNSIISTNVFQIYFNEYIKDK